MSKLYCANCGNSLDENALFCGSCGEKVKFHPTADQLVDENAAAGEKPVISEIAFDKNPYEDRYYAEEGNEPYEYEDPYQEEDFGGAAGPSGNRKNHLPVLLVTAGAAAVAVLVLLIASLGGKSVKTSSGSQSGQNTTSTGSATNTHAAGSEDVEGTRRMVTARAEEVKTIYAQQIASYNDDSDSEVRRVDDTTCYYVDKNLVEVDVPKGHNGSPYHCEYYYRGGDVYYIRVYETINEITELYYENRVLVGWRDPQGYFHDAQSDADIYQQWNIYVDESQNTYNYYENTETNTQNTEYILANSASKYLSAVDVQNLSAEELRLARNEIFARHGRTFRDAELQSYFDSCSWYSGTVDPDTFDSQKGNILSAVEQANLALIQEMENSGKVTSTTAQDAAEAEAKEMAEIASEAEAESTAAPVESTAAPAESAAAPAESTAAPAESTAAPAESTAAPAESTAAPAESAAAPAESTALPAESTAAPAESTAVPAESTAAPAAESSGAEAEIPEEVIPTAAEASETYLAALDRAPVTSEYTSFINNNYQYQADLNTGVVGAVIDDTDGDLEDELIYFELVNRPDTDGTGVKNVLEMVVCEYAGGTMQEVSRMQVLEESILNGASEEEITIAYSDGNVLCTCVHMLTEAKTAEYAEVFYDGSQIQQVRHLYDPGYTSALGLYDVLETGTEYYDQGTEIYYEDPDLGIYSDYDSYETAVQAIFEDFGLTIFDAAGYKELNLPDGSKQIVCVLSAEEQNDRVVSMIENGGISVLNGN